MTVPAAPATPPAPRPAPGPTPGSASAGSPPTLQDTVFGAVWPETDLPGRPAIVARTVAVGALAALVIPFRDLGSGTMLVLLAGGAATVAAVGRARWTPYLIGSLMLCTLLVMMVVVRDAAWISVLCVLAAAAVAVSAVVDARSVLGLLVSATAVPLAALRGLPWLGRSVRGTGRAASVMPMLRTAVISLVLMAVLGGLFASADALFALWAAAVLPDLSLDTVGVRLLVLLVASGTTLATSYVALNPPAVEVFSRPARAVARPFEWLVPVGLVLGVYIGFVAAQLTAMFGGHAYLQSTTGLTYADYVHQGFGQLTVATLLTLGVVATAARKAQRGTGRDRLLVRLMLGALCLLTLTVVASALFRMHVYEQAYGFTRLRVLVSVFEGWLGLVVVLVLVAGVRLDGRWLPRAATAAGAAALLGLALVNPDGYIAQRNVERFVETGKADWYYLAGLSADAVPTLEQLPPEAQSCVFGARVPRDDDWLEWNLGRVRAGQTTLDASEGCTTR